MEQVKSLFAKLGGKNKAPKEHKGELPRLERKQKRSGGRRRNAKKE